MVVPLLLSCVGNTRLICEALILSLLIIVPQSNATSLRRYLGYENKKIHSATFYSEMFELGPGMVLNNFFSNISFPSGHIGVKSFDAELVDEQRNPVPLHETYLHHFFAIKYHSNITLEENPNLRKNRTDGRTDGINIKRNDGPCLDLSLPHYWGLGGDSRKTMSRLFNSFAVEAGNPSMIGEGFVERWMLNLMAIDTRGVKDVKGCTECRCDLYNITSDYLDKTNGFEGKPLTNTYKGGLWCCPNGSQCEMKKGSTQNKSRKLALKYKMTWVDWDKHQIPTMFYILDVADVVTKNKNGSIDHNCKIEYDIPEHVDGDDEYHIKRADIPIKNGGSLVYGTAHVHSGIVNATLYGEDGSVLCAIQPIYGKGNKAGDEKGYAVGMEVCYPNPGVVKISDGETLTVEFVYENRYRTGVMGHFYIHLVDDKITTWD